MSNRRVVVTGIGLITPLGVTVDTSWSGILEGKSGIKQIVDFDISNFTCKIAGLVDRNLETGFNPENYIPARDIRKMDLFMNINLKVHNLLKIIKILIIL